VVLAEPRLRGAKQFTEEQITLLALVPALVEFGDHLDVPTGILGFSRQNALEDCMTSLHG
jgi:hypothetical protein